MIEYRIIIDDGLYYLIGPGGVFTYRYQDELLKEFEKALNIPL